MGGQDVGGWDEQVRQLLEQLLELEACLFELWESPEKDDEQFRELARKVAQLRMDLLQLQRRKEEAH